MSKGELPDVRVGDVWRDNDLRGSWDRDIKPEEARRLRVLKVPSAHELRTAPHPGEFGILCETISGPEGTRVGKRTVIRLRRFRPTRTGYVLVERNGFDLSAPDFS